MKTLKESFATTRQGLGMLALLVGGCALFGALSALLLPVLPADSQRALSSVLGLVPGLHGSLELTRESPEMSASLRLSLDGSIVARFPATEEAWSRGGFELEGPGLPLVLAAWGALVGLVLQLFWFIPASRQVVGIALVIGVVSGLVVARSLPMAPRYWASFWLRGLSGLPGIEERIGSPVGIENQPSSAHLVSSKARIADYPPASPPWPTPSQVAISGHGHAWFAGYGIVAWLFVSLAAAAGRTRVWRYRVPLVTLGLAGTCWVALPFLPRSLGQLVMDLLAGAAASDRFAVLASPFLMEATRLGHDVGFGLLLLLIAAWSLVLTPVGLAAGSLAWWRSRAARVPFDRREAEKLGPATPIPIHGHEDSHWQRRYEESSSSRAQAEEPHPARPAEEP